MAPSLRGVDLERLFEKLALFSYLAYAALSAVGKNPCLLGPSALGEGPVLALVSPRWADTPSAYGPILNLVVWLAGLLANETIPIAS